MPWNTTKPSPIYLMYLYKEFTLNNVQRLICHKTQTVKIIYIYIYIYEDDLVLNNQQLLIYHKT